MLCLDDISGMPAVLCMEMEGRKIWEREKVRGKTGRRRRKGNCSSDIIYERRIKQRINKNCPKS